MVDQLRSPPQKTRNHWQEKEAIAVVVTQLKPSAERAVKGRRANQRIQSCLERHSTTLC